MGRSAVQERGVEQEAALIVEIGFGFGMPKRPIRTCVVRSAHHGAHAQASSISDTVQQRACRFQSCESSVPSDRDLHGFLEGGRGPNTILGEPEARGLSGGGEVPFHVAAIGAPEKQLGAGVLPQPSWVQPSLRKSELLECARELEHDLEMASIPGHLSPNRGDRRTQSGGVALERSSKQDSRHSAHLPTGRRVTASSRSTPTAPRPTPPPRCTAARRRHEAAARSPSAHRRPALARVATACRTAGPAKTHPRTASC